MLFWIASALLAAGVTFAVTRPLLARADAEPAASGSAADIAVYKDQLAEVDADQARGLISETEAQSAKNEIARRLIRTADTNAAVPANAAANPAKQNALYVFAATAIPALSLMLYLAFGNPGLPGQPLKERLAAAPETASAQDLVAKVEAQLREHAEDGKGWDVVAPVYMSLGRFEDAAEAYGKAAQLLGETPKRLNGVANALIRGNDGGVTEGARKALLRSLELDNKQFEPRYWLAVAKVQDGKNSEAIADLRAMLADAPLDAPWRKTVEARVAELEQGPAKIESAAPGTSSQSSFADLDADQRAKIEQMVAGLASRLKSNSADLEGWLRLIKAYKVMARESDAAGALADAKKQFAGNDKALAEIDNLAKSLGLGS